MALAVPLSRFTPRVGGGSAFFVRRMTDKEQRARAIMGFATQIGWLIYVAVVAIWGAIDLYLKHGVGGFFLGLVLGALVGAMSATIWVFVLYFIFRLGRFIFRLCKPSAGGQ